MAKKRIIQIKPNIPVRCLNCNRILRSRIEVHCDDEVYQTCKCGYINFFTHLDNSTWEQEIVLKEESWYK